MCFPIYKLVLSLCGPAPDFLLFSCQSAWGEGSLEAGLPQPLPQFPQERNLPIVNIYNFLELRLYIFRHFYSSVSTKGSQGDLDMLNFSFVLNSHWVPIVLFASITDFLAFLLCLHFNSKKGVIKCNK